MKPNTQAKDKHIFTTFYIVIEVSSSNEEILRCNEKSHQPLSVSLPFWGSFIAPDGVSMSHENQKRKQDKITRKQCLYILNVETKSHCSIIIIHKARDMGDSMKGLKQIICMCPGLVI